MTGAAPVLRDEVVWEEYLTLLDDPAYKNAELIDGQVVVVTPNWLHQRIAAALIRVIGNWVVAGSGRGEVTFNPPVRITGRRAYLPDVAWYSEERLAGAETGGPPDLAVEVLSPSTRAFDLVRKREDCARVGVRELWIVDPEGPAALVLRSGAAAVDLDADGELTSPLLPGLAIRVGALLER